MLAQNAFQHAMVCTLHRLRGCGSTSIEAKTSLPGISTMSIDADTSGNAPHDLAKHIIIKECAQCFRQAQLPFPTSAMLRGSCVVSCSPSALLLCSVVLLWFWGYFLFSGCLVAVHWGAARLVTVLTKYKALIKRKRVNCTQIRREPKEEACWLGAWARFSSVNTGHYCRSARRTSKGAASFRPWGKTKARCKA